MVSAGLITTFLEYPNSPIHHTMENPDLRRALIGLAMGLTAVALTARSFASAPPLYLWNHLWIYFTAPVVGMQLAVDVFRLGKLGREKFCAKLNHDPAYRCIHCGHEPAKHAVGSRDVMSLATEPLSQVRRSQR